ncbi:uncharacterized protein LOC123274057 [Cotesia glomerata]|uniref:uncharacterized protein LOC123274057 n=1 Tax=Cotesia glomerata TaxID=32391 RepID=UPI001D01AEF5|nr:uncharacterized protein LOC123274057 [Cotesia glomerata]
MGGHKRKSSDRDRDRDYEHLKKRMREMEKKLDRQTRAQRSSPDKENKDGEQSSAGNKNSTDREKTNNVTEVLPLNLTKNKEPGNNAVQPQTEKQIPVIDIGTEKEVTQEQKDTQPVNASEKSSDLDPEILKIIGETPSTEPEVPITFKETRDESFKCQEPVCAKTLSSDGHKNEIRQATVQLEVPEPDEEPSRSTPESEQQESESILTNESQQPAAPSDGSDTYPGGRQVIREAFTRKNLPEASIEILSASLAESTIKQYNSALKDWWTFSKKKGHDPFCIEANSVLEFLSEKFRDGAAYGTLNTARSAISLISTQDITNNPIISRFFKGIFKLRPIKPKYDSTWDTEPVITKAADLYPLEKLTLQQLTNKLIILLALGTAHRVQTLSLISIDNIAQYKSSIQIKIPDIIKTSRPGASQPLLILPVFTDKPELCVANTLLSYIKRTKSLRRSEKRLFISIRNPHTAVSSQTLSRWIKIFLVDCGVDEKFTAHSTRHASTSKAAEAGVSLDLIRKTAGWSEKSLVFAKFYNRPISSQNNNNFAQVVLLKSSKK